MIKKWLIVLGIILSVGCSSQDEVVYDSKYSEERAIPVMQKNIDLGGEDHKSLATAKIVIDTIILPYLKDHQFAQDYAKENMNHILQKDNGIIKFEFKDKNYIYVDATQMKIIESSME
ncbi:hypothetical protein RZN22_14710 [Bacillaceae bacterium S4-13-58]